MTQDEIIDMARQAGMYQDLNVSWNQSIQNFAKLVEDKVRQEIAEKNAPVIKKVNEHIKELQDAVKAEREACAKVCEDFSKTHGLHTKHCVAAAIRARGEA
jgi:CHASE3 domain sensor protein